jgi:hypothetical protein
VRLLNLALVLIAALLAVSVAVAKERPHSAATPGSACAPKQLLSLKGTFLAGGPESFQMNVRHASRHERALRGARELRFDAQTRFRRNGAAATLAALQPNDRLHVLVRGCKRPRTPGTELMARTVSAHAPRTT